MALLLFTSVALLVSGGTPSASAETPGRPPSVLLLLTDDQRWDTLSVMPTVRRQIGARGATFTNAYVTTPACCPSRASILTGLLPRHTGVWANSGEHGGFAAFDDRSTLATWLQATGHRTAMFGKYMNGYDPSSLYVPSGWDRWFGIKGDYYGWTALDSETGPGTLIRAGDEPSDYVTRVVTREARSFIEGLPTDTAFFAMVSYKAPHRPFTPDPRDAGALDGLKGWRPPSFNEADVRDKPRFLRARRLDARGIAHIDRTRQSQLEALLGVDRSVGRLLRTLDDQDRMDDTLILYLSDHGFFWGEHRLFGKAIAYEETIRVPMLMRYDGHFAGPLVVERPALSIDLAPTILAVTGAKPRETDGQDLLPILSGAERRSSRTFIVEHWPATSRRGYYCLVRRGHLSYARHHDDEGLVIGEELYDLRVDPYQLQNRVAGGNRARQLPRLRELSESRCLTPSPP